MYFPKIFFNLSSNRRKWYIIYIFSSRIKPYQSNKDIVICIKVGSDLDQITIYFRARYKVLGDKRIGKWSYKTISRAYPNLYDA